MRYALPVSARILAFISCLCGAFLILGLGLPSLQAQSRVIVLQGQCRDSASGDGVGYSQLQFVLPGGDVVGAMADSVGSYEVKLGCLPGDSVAVQVRALGYNSLDTILTVGRGVGGTVCHFSLSRNVIAIDAAWVEGHGGELRPTMQRVALKSWTELPSGYGGVESVVKSLPGVYSRNELSAQYSVRGGSFDENLVYIDGVEVHRPILVRSGQQEGLSVVNPDLVESIEFSAGGFPACYGDKRASVLSIQYRRPRELRASLALSLLENRLYLEAGRDSVPVSAMLGVRYKNTRFLLNTTDQKGEYRPAFFDLQGKVLYRCSGRVEMSLSGLYTHNRYLFIPGTKQTQVGSLLGGMQSLNVYYEGRERDRYETVVGAFTVNWHAREDLEVVGQLHTTWIREHERYDILGEYWLADVAPQGEPVVPNDSASNVGIGGGFDHANNAYQALQCGPQGLVRYKWWQHTLECGAGYLLRYFTHRVNEWHLQDSAGYTLPHDPGAELQVLRPRFASDTLLLHGLWGYAQVGLKYWVPIGRVGIVAGVRLSHIPHVGGLQVSPRASLTLEPQGAPQLSLYTATGIYYQYAHYREMMDVTGVLHPRVGPQLAIHALLGTRWAFRVGDYPFSLQVEAYYKHLRRTIPYRIDNLSLQYEAVNATQGDIFGLDTRVNGELVKGTQSWLSLSLMRARERFTRALPDPSMMPEEGVSFPSPQDQLFAASLYLQDYFPFLPSFRVHLSAQYGTGIPFTPAHLPYGKTVRMPSYKRVDVGFTKVFKDDWHSDRWLKGKANWLRQFSVSVELLNLFNFKNTASYLWVRVPNGKGGISQLAVPNYLTARCVNFRLQLGF